jgi:hypothetical protein
MKLTRKHASLIIELITNAGYVDDGDEILGQIADESGLSAALEQAKVLDELVAICNPLLPKGERIDGEFVKLVRESLDK